MYIRSIVFTNNKTIDEMGQYHDWEYLESSLVKLVDDYDRNGRYYSYVEDVGLMWNGSNHIMIF